MASILLDVIIVLLLSAFGLYSLTPISPQIALLALLYSAVICFLVNDFIKVVLMNRSSANLPIFI
jgi:hypothetical protein